MYNYQLLGELQFWKEYLSDGQPAVILNFGGQSLVIDAELITGGATWPGVPDDVKPFANTLREMNLFSSADYHRALSDNSNPDAELGSLELEDFVTIEGVANEEPDVLADEA